MTVKPSESEKGEKMSDFSITESKSNSRKSNKSLNSMLRHITIEPVLFFNTLGFSISGVITQNLYLERICRVQLGHSAEDCQDLLLHAANKTVEEEVAAFASKLGLYRTMIQFFIPVGFAIFLGPWSDKHGAKIPLLMPLCGYAISSGLYAMFAYLKDIPPTYFLLASIPVSVTGGFVTVVICAMSFISQVTGNDDKSFRFAVLEVCWFMGGPIGIISGAKLYKLLGFAPVFLLSSACFGVAFVLGVILLKDPKDRKGPSEGHWFRDIFDLSAIKETLQVVFAKREPPRRAWLLLSILIMNLKVLSGVGTMSCLFLFTRHQFGWNEQNYSTFTTLESVMGIAGLMIMTFVGLKLLKLSDIFLSIVSTVTAIASNIIVACVPQDPSASWMLYLAAAIQMFGGMTSIMTRSMFAKIVSKEDQGKVFTFAISIEIAMVPLAAGMGFSAIYLATQRVFPGAFSVIVATINVVVLAIIVYLYISVRRTPDIIQDAPTKDADDRAETDEVSTVAADKQFD